LGEHEKPTNRQQNVVQKPLNGESCNKAGIRGSLPKGGKSKKLMEGRTQGTLQTKGEDAAERGASRKNLSTVLGFGGGIILQKAQAGPRRGKHRAMTGPCKARQERVVAVEVLVVGANDSCE